MVIRQRAKTVALHETVQRDRGPRRPPQFLLQTICLHIERIPEAADSCAHICLANLATNSGQFFCLKHLNVTTKVSDLLRQVGIDIQHSSVVVAQNSQTVVFHEMGDASRFDPFPDFGPRNRIVFEHARNLEEGDLAAIKHVRDLRYRASLAVRQPLACHFRSISQTVEACIIDRGRRRKI